MAVRFVVGACGTGKTTYIYDEMIDKSLQEDTDRIIFLLPEQANMAAEQQMVRRHPKGGTMDISIVSFTRLAFMVFDELGYSMKDILDDYGKSMLLMKVLRDNDDKLVYYKGMTGKSGFVEEMKSTICELFQYQITFAQIDETIAAVGENKSLYYKLKDIRFILSAFCDAMAGDYMVAEQILTLLTEIADESAMFHGTEIYIDGFNGFTPAQYDVIEAFLRAGCNLTVSVTMDGDLIGDNGYGETGLFSASKNMYEHICRLADRHRVKVLPHVILDRNRRVKEGGELWHLERNLFRFPARPYRGECRDVRLLEAKDAYEQAEYIAASIKRMVLEQGYRYSDFAVLTGNLSDGADVWKHCFKTAEIPYFMDYNEMLDNNPVMVIVELIFELFRTDFSYNSVFSILKCGLFDLDMDAVYALENYALQYGVRGYSWWSKPFRGGKKGLGDINATRQSFMDGIEPLVAVFSKNRAPAGDYIRCIHDFLAEQKLAYRLHDKALAFERDNDVRKAKTYGQIYDKWIALLDKTETLLGSEVMDRDVLGEILALGISQIKLGSIPATLDQVVVGDLERTKLSEVRILYVADVNEGVVPVPERDAGIFSDRDRRLLRERDVILAPDNRENLLLQQFGFYCQLSKATEMVCIAYKTLDEKGAELEPSYYIGQMKRLFPALKTGKVCLDDGFYPMTDGQVIETFARMLRDESFEDSSVCQIMKRVNPILYGQVLTGYHYNNQAGNLDRAIVRALYGREMVHSVSRLETYSGCAYQFFLRYGLKLAKRPEYVVETSNIGTILHGVMEEFFGEIKRKHIDLSSLPEEDRNRMVEEMTVRWAREENETIFESSNRNKHRLQVLIRIAKRSVSNLCRHLTEGTMEPAFFEKKFSPQDKLSYIRMALEDDICMELSGIIDRVDIKETEDAVYVKVIDYKSGAKDIDFTKMLEGQQLQLTVYMSVMKELLERQYPGKAVIPTGMYYFRLSDRIVDAEDDDVAEAKRVEESRLTGLVNQSEICREIMDGRTGHVTPVHYKKDMEPYSVNNALVSTEELMRISEFVRGKMTDIGNDIVRGQIVMNPEKGELSSPCNYCEYKSICRFEPGLGGNEYRIHENLSKYEARDAVLGRKTEEGEGSLAETTSEMQQNEAGGADI